MKMGEKPGKVQALGVEFSPDCTVIRTKNGEGGYAALDKGGLYFLYL